MQRNSCECEPQWLRSDAQRLRCEAQRLCSETQRLRPARKASIAAEIRV